MTSNLSFSIITFQFHAIQLDFRLFEYGGILSLSCSTPVALFIKFWLWCSECNVAE